MFKVRSEPCSFNKTVYEEDRDSFNCQGSINAYHCIQNERNRSGEICIQPVWVQPHYCPEYNTGANTLDTVPCNVSSGCPDVLYLSDEVYKYPVCLNKTFTDSEDVAKDVVSSMLGVNVGIAVSLLIVLLAVCLFLLYYRRRGQHGTEDEEIPLIDEFNIELPFHKTSAFHEGVKFINKNGGKILCFGGRWGSGRTSTAKQVYAAVTKSPPIIISDPLSFDVSKHYKPIILDYAFSKGISQTETELLVEKINTLFKNVSSSTSDTKVFIIFKLDEDMKTVPEFVKSIVAEKDTKFIDLSKSLTKGDRIQILSSHFETFCSNEDFSKVESLAMTGNDSSLGYPEICALISRCRAFQQSPVLFCNRPLGFLKSYLETMHTSDDKNKFFMLVYMSLNGMEIDSNDRNDKLFEFLESCNCDSSGEEIKCKKEQNKNTGTEIAGETSTIHQEFSSKDKPKKHPLSEEDIPSLIPKEFVKKEASNYRLQHDVIKRMTLIVYGTYHFDKLLTLCNLEELRPWVKEKSNLPSIKQGDIKPILEINGDEWKQYQAMLSR